MPKLAEVTYSHRECIDSFRSYYKFLTTMYLSEAEIQEPPKGGWTGLEILKDGLDKTEEVILLLRSLPYIRRPVDGTDVQAAPYCYFADWHDGARSVAQDKSNFETLKILSEDYYEYVPPDVIGLTIGGRNNPVLLLDTKLGIIHWTDCPTSIKYDRADNCISHDFYEEGPENEAEWREDSPAWSIPDFFNLLKDQFRSLRAIPITPREVVDVHSEHPEGMLPMIQKIYLDHGWPDNLESYDKQKCLEDIQKALRERYPDYAETVKSYAEEDE
jgi:hypothetical protein